MMSDRWLLVNARNLKPGMIIERRDRLFLVEDVRNTDTDSVKITWQLLGLTQSKHPPLIVRGHTAYTVLKPFVIEEEPA
jgi:hypothetical protein